VSELTYPHVLQQDYLGRKGARCEIITFFGARVRIQFEDGVQAVVNRVALRRADSKNRAASERNQPKAKGTIHYGA
jgi:hypothetical protein